MANKFIKKAGKVYLVQEDEILLARYEKRLIALDKAHQKELAELDAQRADIDARYKASKKTLKDDIKEIKKLTK